MRKVVLYHLLSLDGVAPAVVGRGRRVLEGDDAVQPLELLDVQRSPKGTLFLAYRFAGAATA
jgi:hypothetical protein